ncbi:hypothetical protein AXX17_AT5G35300 [Arabidopsis thaliana]|uniref:Uncharacterized protein n=1 Tax=Arabidopsis thaliana TaxID=3702 RepID=A0A178UCZ6_ARATH|nr:hypothetical protein AXX17_AT5G35300 [Arabidopsis thaliana]
MVRPIIATSSVNPNPSMEEPCVMMEHVEPYVHNVRQTHDQRRIVCPTDHEMVTSESHVLLAKACEIFIEEEVPHDVVHQQVFTSANVNVPTMKDPIDIDQIQLQCLYYLTTEHFIDIGEFELDSKYKVNFFEPL